MSSETNVIRCLLASAKALREAGDQIRSDTEYLRDDIQFLLIDVGVLLDKMQFESVLLEARDVLHGNIESASDPLVPHVVRKKRKSPRSRTRGE